ncbi:MAG: hypothetical protein KAG82_09550 [Alcanivoracaceae bacterium]|jgi:hypothetical protein|nr:hypothetical protein [Alcanivoracaceae bacterium]
MIHLLRSYRRSRIIAAYIRQIGPALLKRYGTMDQYAVRQIEATARQLGISLDCLPYAIALYRREESENTRTLYALSQPCLDALRKEIAEAYFAGDADYSAMQAIALGQAYPWKGGMHTNWMQNIYGKTGF